MGADFLFHLMPWCELTNERQARLITAIESITEEEFLDIEFYVAEDLENLHVTLTDYALDYLNWAGRRDVGCFHIENIAYLLTGGMSHGDSPTDAFDMFMAMAAVPRIYDLILVWAEEDYLNTEKVGEGIPIAKRSEIRIIRADD